MSDEYWKRQEPGKALFQDILWSRPENKGGAGKLAVIGGNQHGFGAPGTAYSEALTAGAGVATATLPDKIKPIVKHILPDAEYAPSTPSGSFSRRALDTLILSANWSDMVLLAGDFGRNSETAMMLETFAEKYSGPLTVTQDAVDYFIETPLQIIDRLDTLVVLSLSQLQKIFISTPFMIPITFGISTPQLANALHEYTQVHVAALMVQHNGLIFAASGGQVVTTKSDDKIWRVKTAAKAAAFYMQNPQKPLESIVTSLSKEVH